MPRQGSSHSNEKDLPACRCCPNELLLTSPRVWNALQQICFGLVHDSLHRPRQVTSSQVAKAATLLHWTSQDYLLPLLKQSLSTQDARLFRRVIRALLSVLINSQPRSISSKRQISRYVPLQSLISNTMFNRLPPQSFSSMETFGRPVAISVTVLHIGWRSECHCHGRGCWGSSRLPEFR